MTQAVKLTKEHLLHVSNILQNSKGGKDCSYSGCQELKQTIFNTYFIVTLEFPKQNFNKLKNKIAKLIDLEIKDDESDKKSSYLHTIIYLDTVLETLQSKQSRGDRLFTELGEIRSRLTTAKIALLTATHLKPANQNLDPTKNQEQNLITSHPNPSRKNPIGIKKILLEQIRGTINCLNSDFEILEKNRLLKYQGELFSISFSAYCNNASKIQGMMQEITYLLNSNHPNIKPIQAKLHSIHLKLDFLKHLMKLHKKALDQEKTGVIHSRFLDLYGIVEMENEFIQKLLKIKQLFKNTSVFDKFLRLEKIIFNPMNSTNIVDAVDIELARIKLQNIKKILDALSPYIIQIKNEKDKETVNSLLDKFKELVTSSQINDLLNHSFITIKENSLKKNQSHEQNQQSSPPLPHKKNKRNENNAGNYKENRFFKPSNQIKPLNNITNFAHANTLQ
ncbi:MAG: hypothetical protein O7D30_07650 [Rickettsia endosymbiont of Ixodes persulcatus]|nr:hypothetical protein [Rickettsia endosymbiont of Ixodes persulcatus]